MFLKAHLTIPYASLNHLYQTSCRIRLRFILFCFSFFTMCLCIFTQFALFFLPNYRFESSAIAEQLCYCPRLTPRGPEEEPVLEGRDTCAVRQEAEALPGRTQGTSQSPSYSNWRRFGTKEPLVEINFPTIHRFFLVSSSVSSCDTFKLNCVQ